MRKLLEFCKTKRLSGDYSCIKYLFQLCLFPILSLNEFPGFCHKYSSVSIKIRMSIYGRSLGYMSLIRQAQVFVSTEPMGYYNSG